MAVLSLALSVGANSAVFSIVNALRLTPPPVADPARLAVVYSTVPASSRGEVFDHFRFSAGPALARLPGVAAATFELSATERFGDWRPVVRLKTTGSTLRATAVAHDYFSVLGVAIVGRAFRPDEDRRGADPVAVVSDRLWRQWQSDGSPPPEYIPTTRGAIRIVGVAPSRFHGPRLGDQADVWIPFGVLDRFSDMLTVSDMAPLMPVTAFVRIQTGSSPEAVERALQTDVSRRLTLRSLSDTAFKLRADADVTRQSDWLVMHWITSALVLLFGAATLAVLWHMRLDDRRGEIACRLALGASRRGITAMLLVEMATLTVAGAAAGVWTSQAVLTTISTMTLPVGVTLADLNLRIDWRVMVFGMLVAGLSVAAAAIAVLRDATSVNVSRLLMAAGERVTDRSGHRRAAMVFTQGVLSTTILTITCALIWGLYRASGEDIGVARHELLLVKVRPRLTQHFDPVSAQDNPEARWRDYDQTLVRLRTLPGVADATVGRWPITDHEEPIAAMVLTEGRQQSVVLQVLPAGPRYLQVIGAQVLAGTTVDATSEAAPADVEPVVVDQALADRLWPGDRALGRTFELTRENARFVVAGVIRDVRRGVTPSHRAGTIVRRASMRGDDGTVGVTFVIRGHSAAALDEAAVRQTLTSVFPDPAVLDVRHADEMLKAMQSEEHMAARVFAWYGLTAAALSAVAVHGVIVMIVRRRRRDLAIRLALGADLQALRRSVIGHLMAPLVWAAAVGVVAGAGAMRLIATLLPALTPVPVAAVAAVVALAVLAGAGIAGVIASRHIGRGAPLELLRQE